MGKCYARNLQRQEDCFQAEGEQDTVLFREMRMVVPLRRFSFHVIIIGRFRLTARLVRKSESHKSLISFP